MFLYFGPKKINTNYITYERFDAKCCLKKRWDLKFPDEFANKFLNISNLIDCKINKIAETYNNVFMSFLFYVLYKNKEIEPLRLAKQITNAYKEDFQNNQMDIGWINFIISRNYTQFPYHHVYRRY